MEEDKESEEALKKARDFDDYKDGEKYYTSCINY